MSNAAALIVNKTVGEATQITLPARSSPPANRFVIISDGKGDAATNNITVVPAAGTITGLTSIVLNSNYESAMFFDNGTTWTVVSRGGSASGVSGSAGSVVRIVRALTGMADNTNVQIATITVANLLCGGGVTVRYNGTLGDGDSSETAEYNIAISRIAGAAAGATLSAKIGAAVNNGVTGNAAATFSLGSVGGAVGATNTFALNVKIARSAGTSTNHFLTAEIITNNSIAGAVTVN